MMLEREHIKLYEGGKNCTEWVSEREKFYSSIIDLVGVLLDQLYTERTSSFWLLYHIQNGIRYLPFTDIYYQPSVGNTTEDNLQFKRMRNNSMRNIMHNKEFGLYTQVEFSTISITNVIKRKIHDRAK